MATFRRCAMLAILILALVSTVACSQTDSLPTESTAQTTEVPTTSTTADETTPTTSEGTVLTLDQLTQYDGADGRSAYVAVDGVVYDVTGSRMWSGGAHAVCGLSATAGQDLSEVIKKAPSNMRALLENMPVVGELAP